ncbi:M23 family metallopeptidase, partial [Candidatus Collierbacteria bacterium]|nr:M23 family metallopeptidase [Candidatus Collierbacteria bacterium]
MIDIKKWLPKTRVSNPVSKLFRPMFEAKKAKAAFGGFLSVASLLMVGVYPLAKQTPVSALEPTSLPIEVITAGSGPSLLLPQMTGVSQGFWSEHPGVDITALSGAAIYPIKSGKVVEVSISRFNYGRSVVINHGDNLSSRYAHMGKIMVQEGDEVDDKTEIGEVGVTGHTTGPHLHLEIRK